MVHIDRDGTDLPELNSWRAPVPRHSHSPSQAIIVGIDGGGSKTLIASADRGGQLISLERGRGTSPLESPGWREALAELARPFAGASGLAGVAAALPAYGEVEAASTAQRQAIGELFGAAPQRLLNDVDAANIGAFAGGPGILILAGTGSMAWARDPAGNSHRTGGWGEVIGDEGSGYWIGNRVLGAISKALDERAAPTALVDAVFDRLGLASADGLNDLVGWASRLGEARMQIAALAPLALALAEQGDPTAGAIVDAAAAELALHVRTLERRLAAPTMAWSFAGGLFASPALRRAVTRHVGRPPSLPRLPPVGGALLAAAQHLGWPIDEGWIDTLAGSLGELSGS
ncbi:BadF/BadG/BcrA/BcrD ATPase family protein [Devosia sp. Root105]|uniref:N-acetylglucosamine kinase n=1 Tax=Devosia sp. Root105 TaxID=1736423 RepID=UPI0009EB7910|nr:BadF/BadG/BcrA/BcrD ATPase family protein [Devosia sp. Root105]